MNSYKELIPLMVVDLPGCLEQTILQALQQAGRDFCRETECWTVCFAYVDIVEGVTKYELEPQGDSFIHKIVAVKIDGTLLRPEDYELSDNWQITLQNIPDADIDNGLEIEVILRPEYDAMELTEDFMSRHADALIASAKAVLMQQPGKPYSNPQLGERFELRYEKLKNEAVWEKYTGHKVQDVTVEQLGGLW